MRPAPPKPRNDPCLALARAENRSRKGGLSVYGTNVLMNISSAMGALPTKNSQVTSFGDRAEKLSGEYVNDHYLVHNPTCHACPVACGFRR